MFQACVCAGGVGDRPVGEFERLRPTLRPLVNHGQRIGGLDLPWIVAQRLFEGGGRARSVALPEIDDAEIVAAPGVILVEAARLEEMLLGLPKI